MMAAIVAGERHSTPSVLAQAPLPPALAEFLKYVVSKQGQQIVLNEAIYLPLRAWQAKSSLKAIER